ncbi:camphor resistance protein CrcB [Intrasporangium oryzae NRRL B-24470]|uniref:Fluoride-specific ion channel FluC n=1 Tax=Intrasporangium oryzae NRRL B-24470 TaxID=1386089 RepID=W9G9H9_9MICO|nr:CrcB family protein [Intrasporangium oryzae]EWT01902.1 camphor resistance protein CrcB [Intrasporangium oryzae NRRL B-24470]
MPNNGHTDPAAIDDDPPDHRRGHDTIPTDPDVTAADRPRAVAREGLVRGRLDVLGVIAVGGALGSAARFGLATIVPHGRTEIAWSTVIANLTGAFLLGLLMVFVNEVWPPQRYVRPFLGVGVLGGYTTFSTYMLDAHALVDAGRALSLVTYLLSTLVGGLVAVWLGAASGRLVVRRGRGGVTT